jgi:hypothetical protein
MRATIKVVPGTVRATLFVASPGDLTVTRGTLGGSSSVSRFTETTAVSIASALPLGAAGWLVRPTAGFAIEQSVPEYVQALGDHSPSAGNYPLQPWAGLAVFCGYAALALGLAMFRLRGRDA